MTTEQQGMDVIGRGVCRIRKSFLPHLEVDGIVKPDVVEQVLSGAWNPGFRDETTVFECLGFIAQEFDDGIEDLWGR